MRRQKMKNSCILKGYELSPCPFCGSLDLALELGILGKFVWVECKNIDCRASGPVDLGLSGAIEKWNMAERIMENGTNL